jgi:hypothetical protein
MDSIIGWFASLPQPADLWRALQGLPAAEWPLWLLASLLPLLASLPLRLLHVTVAELALGLLLAALLTGRSGLPPPWPLPAAALLVALMLALLVHGRLLRERRRAFLGVQQRLAAIEDRLDTFLSALDQRARLLEQHSREVAARRLPDSPLREEALRDETPREPSPAEMPAPERARAH